jgi:hypothetical protein
MNKQSALLSCFQKRLTFEIPNALRRHARDDTLDSVVGIVLEDSLQVGCAALPGQLTQIITLVKERIEPVVSQADDNEPGLFGSHLEPSLNRAPASLRRRPEFERTD